MSEPFEPGQAEEPDAAAQQPSQATIVDVPGQDAALPALVDPRIIAAPAPVALPERSPALMIPAVQAAAVAAGGFVAGVAVVGLVHRRQRRSALAKGRGAGRRLGARSKGGAKGATKGGELLQIVGSRSLLVDVHLLGGRGGER